MIETSCARIFLASHSLLNETLNHSNPRSAPARHRLICILVEKNLLASQPAVDRDHLSGHKKCIGPRQPCDCMCHVLRRSPSLEQTLSTSAVLPLLTRFFTPRGSNPTRRHTINSYVWRQRFGKAFRELHDSTFGCRKQFSAISLHSCFGLIPSDRKNGAAAT